MMNSPPTPILSIELVLKILPIVISSLAFFISFLSYLNSKRSSYEKNRPEIVLQEVSLFPDLFHVYVGNDINWWNPNEDPNKKRPDYDKKIEESIMNMKRSMVAL